MRDFFERQETARKRTGFLIGLFFIAVTLIVLSVYLAVSAVFFMNKSGQAVLWDPMRFLIVLSITLLIVMGGTIYKISQLRGGGSRVAEMLGARPVTRNTSDLDEKKLLNVVEEMAIASGVPVPDVYVMDRETGINAFAAGFTINDAVVCVTRGAMTILNRDELQGVIAHEFSHILNSDMAINIRLMGWLHGILLIGLIGEGILRGLGDSHHHYRSSRSRGKGSGGIVLFGLALLIIGYVGVFFGNLIKSAVSRQREYLADASAVQFTRNPSGLAGALKKVGGLTMGSLLMHPRAGEASHMYISNGVGRGLSAFEMLSTHPPLEDRIRRLDPRFDGTYPQVEGLSLFEPGEIRKPPEKPKPTAEAFSAAVTGAAVLSILNTAGKPMQQHVEMARLMLAEVPDTVYDAAREPTGACALVYALLLEPEEGKVREKQMALLEKVESKELIEETQRLEVHVPGIKRQARLPLVDIMMPALRQLSDKQYRSFKQNVHQFMVADMKLSLFEYVLRHVLIRRLDAHFTKPQKKFAQIYSIRGVVHECSVILSVFAHLGHRDKEQAARAFEHASRLLGPKVQAEFLSTQECTLKELDRALDRLAITSAPVKRQLLAACQECLTFDQKITVSEVELFRAVTESLGVPAPPWLIGSEAS